jgi:hypothetical protein
MSSEQVAQVLRMAGSEVKLVVARPIEASEVETIKDNESIVPTRLLSDPEVLERHLMHSQQVNNLKQNCFDFLYSLSLPFVLIIKH